VASGKQSIRQGVAGCLIPQIKQVAVKSELVIRWTYAGVELIKRTDHP
jgi:hypothetical protein